MMQVHNVVLSENGFLHAKITQINEVQAAAWTNLQDMFNHGLCLVQLFSDFQS